MGQKIEIRLDWLIVSKDFYRFRKQGKVARIKMKTTTEFWKVLRMKNLKQIKSIWRKDDIRLKNEKTFLQILMIIAILSKSFTRKHFRLVFDYFGPHFGIRKLKFVCVNECLFDLMDENDCDYDKEPEYENHWTLTGKNDHKNQVYYSGFGNIEKQIERVGFQFTDQAEDTTFYKFE